MVGTGPGQRALTGRPESSVGGPVNNGADPALPTMPPRGPSVRGPGEFDRERAEAAVLELLAKTFAEDHEELIMVRDIPLYSMCEHHLAPFHGMAHVGYIPSVDGRVTGLSK